MSTPTLNRPAERRAWGGAGPLYKRMAASQVKQVGERTLRFVISTPSVDRDGDTINPAGWDLDNFRVNPVVLFGHDYYNPPVARATYVGVEGGALVADATFADAETYAFADTIFRLYLGGFMRAVSVGFMPLEWAHSSDTERPFGIDFTRQELLEFSCVPVPSNPEALRVAGLKSGGRSLGAGVLSPSEGRKLVRAMMAVALENEDSGRGDSIEQTRILRAVLRLSGGAGLGTGPGGKNPDLSKIALSPAAVRRAARAAVRDNELRRATRH